ncbi:alpha-(1,3)-fucosyltransferase C-like [Ornithodoros turicata]|uniref:alpha-(1,3)-fucosyltransferase C-like n=1 Tax=Ornithodoros turicata TaxID=34597 RepID=UPI00313993D2
MRSRKLATKLSCAIVLLTAGLFAVYLSSKLRTTQHTSRPLSYSPNLSTKYILTWTSFFGDVHYIPSTVLSTCGPLPPCVVTHNRSLLNDSDLVIFHQRDIEVDDLPPERSSRRQRWALLNHEAPPHTPRVPAQIEGEFNWTVTYREDSDVILRPKLARLHSLSESPKPRNWWTNKTRHVVWFVSNCNTPSNREGFVEDLSQHIKVDIIGQCGQHSCLPKMSQKCYSDASNIYFFYLALENSICTDYVTEKLYNALLWGMVPVVFGGANYKKVAPPNSYIDALSFETTKDLADHLKRVSRDALLYNSYHTWRLKYKFTSKHFICELCSMLHTSSPEKTYANINDWWFGSATCKKWMKVFS